MVRDHSKRERAYESTFGAELPRRDSAIVVGVTATIVGLLVLWMTQSGATYRDGRPAEESADININGERVIAHESLGE